MKKEISNLEFSMSGKNTIVIKWAIEKKLGGGIRDIVNIMQRKNIKRAIIVVDEGITSTCKEILSNVRKTLRIIIDIWLLKESLIFAPDHVLVPKHRICSINEKKNVLKAYGISVKRSKEKLPRIKTDDVMVKYLGASSKQLIEIERPSETDISCTILTYRLVW